MVVQDLVIRLQQSLSTVYRIEREITGGGMSRVFAAEELALGRTIVIKVLPPELSEGVSVERFRRETQMAAQLRHPNIVPVLSAGEADGLLYFTMPFIEGESLRARLRREGRLSIRAALKVVREVAGALEYAHSRGVLHRDIKPENILLESDQAVVADFGIARAISSSAPRNTTITAVGMALGTPQYMSPEQAMGEREQDARSDLYSLGCVLYELLTGSPPFSGSNTVAIISKHLTAPVPPVATRDVTIPPGVQRILDATLAKDPADRFARAADLCNAVVAMMEVDDEVLRTPESFRSASFPRPASVQQTPTSGTSSIKSAAIDAVAVLPFSNSDQDADTEYLSEGITENIINRLTRMPGLRIVPRSTIVRYKGRDSDLRSVATELQVRGMVTGRVRRIGQMLVIKSELVDVDTDRQLWGEEYRRTLDDILAIQDEMAEEISKSLRLKLTPEDRAQLLRRYTDDPAAYQAYLRGRHHWNKRNADGFQRAQEHFQSAIDIDAGYALAYSGLADTFNVLGYYNIQPPRDAYPRAKASAARALEIDDALAPAHASLGYARLFYDWDWAGAAASFRRAIELDPTYASAHQWYGWYWLVMERFDETIAAMQKAQELDPLSLVINDHLGYAYYLAGKDDVALGQLERTRNLDPSYPLSHWRLGTLFFRRGEYDKAAQSFRRTVELTDGRHGGGYYAQALVAAGRSDEARDVLAGLERRRAQSYASPLEIALAKAALGDDDAAFHWLSQARDERTSDVVRVKLLSWPDRIRADRRFADFVTSIGLLP